MQPSTPTQPPVVLDYQDPVRPRLLRASGVAQAFAGVLTLAALGMDYGIVYQGWGQNPVLAASAVLLFAAAVALALRSANLCERMYRVGWVGAVAVFGLWTAIVLSNQFHGRPPPSDRYYIAGFGVSFILSAFALATDPWPRPAD